MSTNEESKKLTTPKITLADIEANIDCEYYFTAADATGGATNVQIAKVTHEVNRAYCQALGDESQPAWEAAPQWQQDSAMLGVKLHVDHPDAEPRASHESWMKQKVSEGWIYGPEKRVDLKQHPCLVPFDELPREQQAKDYLFRSVVHSVGSVFAGLPQHESLRLLTFCVLVLRNGFTVTGESACVSPENFDAELGRKIARQKAVEKIWPLMGYELCSRLASRNNQGCSIKDYSVIP